jgi:hypothetical protein
VSRSTVRRLLARAGSGPACGVRKPDRGRGRRIALGFGRRPVGVRTSLGLRAQSWRVAAQIGTFISAQESADLQALCEVARPGLEPGTPRSSGSRRMARLLMKDLQISMLPRWRAALQCCRFRLVGCAFGTSCAAALQCRLVRRGSVRPGPVALIRPPLRRAAGAP